MNLLLKNDKIRKKAREFIENIYIGEDDDGNEYNPFEEAYDNGYEDTMYFLEGCVESAVRFGYRIAKAEAKCLRNE